MTVVDVRAFLDDPTDENATTRRIEELSIDLAADGGGVMHFAPGDYHVRCLEFPDNAFRSGNQTSFIEELDRYHQGGVTLRPGVSLVGEPGTRLIWAEPASDPDPLPPDSWPKWYGGSIIGCTSPFVWTGDATTGTYADAGIVENVKAGQTTFKVGDGEATVFAEGDAVVIRR